MGQGGNKGGTGRVWWGRGAVGDGRSLFRV